ncbi:hypothetical protein KQY30_35575 [Streptomyces sp. GMY02]|uniref:hypothetical protein n=1 Tax=Streptomyces sp. GMY02 TaxID=1333528 RepID=UPI001C2C42BF|nr:hypothetical protein [Streptomyces sp. GMY02]QXE38743.1 hypothetical protein KQY30_35575 [Streptomyces sp. GMY02]
MAAVAAGAALALTPSYASAAEHPISGTTSSRCWKVSGTYGYRESPDLNTPGYITWGSYSMNRANSNCTLRGVFQFKGKVQAGIGAPWITYNSFRTWNSTNLNMGFRSRNIQFRVCNLTAAGETTGCARVV